MTSAQLSEREALVADLAERLRAAEERRAPIAPLTADRALTIDEAYAI
jgi:2-keto-4-pentenoate hydratase